MWSRVYLAGSITLLSNHPFVIGTRLRPEKMVQNYEIRKYDFHKNPKWDSRIKEKRTLLPACKKVP